MIKRSGLLSRNIRNKILRIVSVVLVFCFLLTGCSTFSKSEDSSNEVTNTPPVLNETAAIPTFKPGESTDKDSTVINTPEPTDDSSFAAKETQRPSILTEDEKQHAEQLRSFSMMYYLAITAEEIRTSKDNRLMLDDIYTSLLNDINPGAVDEITQDHLRNLRDIIKSYLQISTKRERLQFIYNQSKASAIRSAVPNPLAILSTTRSLNWKQLAISAVYTTVDSFVNYKNASDAADTEFLMSGWDLDDEEIATVQKNRDRAFDYMVDMVQAYNLDGKLTLNEKSIEKFAEICRIESTPERIRRLVSEEKTYRLLGNYWLELAECYFDTSKYDKCLECIENYRDLSIGIYRQDYNYVRILPMAIVSAQNVYSGQRYISVASEYVDAIMSNTSTEDWSIRYFAAQVYLDLYSRTSDKEYLLKAYWIAYDNVTVLLQGQRDLNNTYLSDVKEIKIEEPDYRYMSEKQKDEKKEEYKAEKKRLKEYNKSLKEKRKTELPPLYEPLILNCELLFALAEEMNISDSDKKEIEAILATETNGVFLSLPINDKYSFSRRETAYTIEFDKDEIIIPANLLTDEAQITITVIEGSSSETFNDCTVTKVERKGNVAGNYRAHVVSKTLKKYEWTADSKITVTITYADAYDETIDFRFYVSEYTEHWYGDTIVFSQE